MASNCSFDEIAILSQIIFLIKFLRDFIIFLLLRKFKFPILLLQNECLKKKSVFYLDFEMKKIAGLGLKIAIFSKTAIFAISKKLILWYKTIELFMVNYKILYDLEDWFKCFWNFRTCSLIYRHTVILSGNRFTTENYDHYGWQNFISKRCSSLNW